MELDSKQIRARLSSYDRATLDQARSLVASFLEWDLRRHDASDRKASLLLGYTGVLIGALIPWLLTHSAGEREIQGYAAALGLASVAAVLSFSSLRARGGWSRLSDDSIFPRRVETDPHPDAVQRFWVLAVHGLYVRHRRKCDTKAARLIWAQAALVASIVAVAVCVGLRLASLYGEAAYNGVV